jgi:threonine dehydratase
MIARDGISAAYERIKPYVRRTPAIDAGGGVSFKLELLQHAGSFKPRGAFANLLGTQVPAAGVAAASGGNHGAAVAYAAQALGHRATIFIPEISAAAKVARIKSYGAEARQKGANYQAALGNCAAFIAETGALGVHAYDSEATLLGQGTVGLEIEEQGSFDTVLVAVGGGGLIGGIAAWFSGRAKVVGVEPETCNALHAALAAGQPVPIAPSGVAADSLGASSAGPMMFEIAKRHVDHVALITDASIRAAQRDLWDRFRLVTEPGGAAAYAALLSGAYRPQEGERVCAVLCGANTDPISFAQAIAT